jgi:hypothetical protein
MIKSRRIRWVGHVTRMGKGSGVYRVLVGKPGAKKTTWKDHTYGRIILTWIFRKWGGGLGWIDLAKDGARWRALVNEVTTFGSHKMLS